MVDGNDNDKAHRLREFFRRLKRLPPAADAQEAMQQITDTLNEVEDELSGIPANPDLWQSDGRMYPPRDDSRRSVPGHVDVVRYRARGHNVFLRANGAIQVRELGN
ncbi:MAG: hypothetical protein JNK15_25225, partial [Planctomycetes bacterium]|nr:hypothetical protein [Planctomycetota bacterium]